MCKRLTRGLHFSHRFLRQASKTNRTSPISSRKKLGNVLSIPKHASSNSPTPLTQRDIDKINYMFLSRTKVLEPGVEVKDLNRIKREFYSRYGARYLHPCNSWLQRSEQKILGKHFTRSWINAHPKYLDVKKKESLEFDIKELMSRPLQIGDLVLLKNQSPGLCMCIDVPSSTMDPRYTFVTADGTIDFSIRSMVLLRIPFHLPKVPLLMKEMKHGFEPIGRVKNKPTETYILPILPRQQITNPISHEISKAAWEKMPPTLEKLEILHRYLQDARGPWQISFIDLVNMVERLDSRLASSEAGYIKDLINDCCTEPKTTLSSSTFLSVYLSVESQQKSHLWGNIHLSRALLSPVSVTVMPLRSQHLYYDSVLQDLRADNYNLVSNFAKLMNFGKYKEAIVKFPEIIKLLQDYAAGNFYNDATVVSVVCKIFRKLHCFQGEDITRDVCHELLKLLDPSRTPNNPLHYNLDLGLPVSSLRSNCEQQIYSLAHPRSLQENKYLRHVFENMKVYCIDSEVAHEIDDGISIEIHDDGKRTLHIHIADPASFFSECQQGTNGIESEILQIALDKSFTTYLPDLMSPMLPESYNDAAGLGKEDCKTKSITFSVDGSWINGHFQLQPESFRIRLGLVCDVSRLTYGAVDEILEEASQAESYNGTSLMEDKKNLKELYNISKDLRGNRIKSRGAIVFGNELNKGQVEISPNETDDILEKVLFKDQIETPSSLLVSEMMILANTMSGQFFADNKLPGVFRSYQQLILGVEAQSEYDALKHKIKQGQSLTSRDTCMISTILNSSFYSSDHIGHELIGASHYLTITSPLRRFPDMINHLQIHRFLKGLPLCFSKNDVDRFVWHIQSRDCILKDASRRSNTYWTLKYLQKLIENDEKIKKFSVMVNSVPQLGFVKCTLPDYSTAIATLKLKPNHTPLPAIGDIVKDCKITKIDALEGQLEMEA